MLLRPGQLTFEILNLFLLVSNLLAGLGSDYLLSLQIIVELNQLECHPVISSGSSGEYTQSLQIRTQKVRAENKSHTGLVRMYGKKKLPGSNDPDQSYNKPYFSKSRIEFD